MKTFVQLMTLIALGGMVLGCASATQTPIPSSTQAPPCEGPQIVIGDISDDPDEVIRNTKPLADYLAKQLMPLGIVCGGVRVANNVDEMIARINTGEVDIYFDSMFPTTLVSDATGAKPILRRWRDCNPEYFSIIFTTTDSGITAIEDLPGHVIAMDRPDSTSGLVLPAAYLINHGLNLIVTDTFDQQVANNQVGIFFSFDDDNTRALILAGKVVAGATDDYHFGKWEQESLGKLVKLAETDSVPRQAVLLRANLDSNLQAAIKEALLKSHLNPTGLAALKKAADTCKFDDAPKGIDGAFVQMRGMLEKIRAIPGWQKAFQETH